MKIPFTKAHGAKNDFLLTWEHEAPEGDRAAMARAICERHTGIGADGWMLVAKPGRWRGRGVDSTLQFRRQHGGDLRQRHALRRGLPDPPRLCRRRSADPHRRRHQDAAPAETQQPDLRIRDEHGPSGNSGRALPVAARRRTARCDAAGGGQSAMRRAGGEFRFRLARDGRGNRIATRTFPGAPTYRSSSRWTPTPSTFASTNGARARP